MNRTVSQVTAAVRRRGRREGCLRRCRPVPEVSAKNLRSPQEWIADVVLRVWLRQRGRGEVQFMGTWSKQVMSFGVVALLSFVLGLGAASLMKSGKDTEPGQGRSESVQRVDRQTDDPALYPFRIFQVHHERVSIPPLKDIVVGTKSDSAALARIVAYYREHEGRFREHWQERNRARLQAFFAMYVVHVSHPYGAGSTPETLLAFTREATVASCREYSIFQARILSAFGLKWRYVAVSSGMHGWIEVDINGRWEIFDSTVNLWIDRSAFELLEGGPRRYRQFYTPWSDMNRPEARVSVTGLQEPIYHTPGTLRSNMPGLGIYFLRKEDERARGTRIEIWDNFRRPSPDRDMARDLDMKGHEKR